MMIINKKKSGYVDKKTVDDINITIKSIETKIPFLTTFTTEERKSLAKIGDKGITFITKTLEFAANNPDIIPRGFDIEEYRKKVETSENLFIIMNQLAVISRKLEDTYKDFLDDSFSDSRSIYKVAKLAGIDIGDFEEIVKELGKIFARKSRKKTDEQQ
jgi:hypothetical protein